MLSIGTQGCGNNSDSGGSDPDAVMTAFRITVPATVASETDFTITVTVIDQDGNDFIGYSGTVTVSASGSILSSATGLSLVFDGSTAAMSISDAQFDSEAADVTITATDGTYSGTFPISVSNTPVLTSLNITAPASVDEDTDFTITVEAIDQLGAPFELTGDVVLTTDASTAVLSSATGLTLSFTGETSLAITDARLDGPESGIHVIATASGTTVSGQSGAIAVQFVPQMTAFKVVAPSLVPTGMDFAITVTAIDQVGIDFFGYTGTVTLSASASNLTSATGLSLVFDGSTAAMSISDAQFDSEAADVTITATDGTYTGTAQISISNTPALTSFNVITPPLVDEDTDFPITVEAIDQFGVPFLLTGDVVLTTDASTTVLSSATGLTLSFAGVPSLLIPDARFDNGPESGVHIIATASGTTISGQSDTIEIVNQVPTAQFKNEIVVSDSAVSEVNGSYFEDTANGPIDDKPLYKHATENYYIFHSTKCQSEWWLGADYSSGNGGDSLYRVDDIYDLPTPSSGVWTITCGNTGDTSHPTIRNLGRITGPLWVGQALTAPEYTYQDAEGNPEGASLTEWYRYDDPECTTGETQIGTSATYTLVAGDVGKYLQYRATPVAAQGSSPGTPVACPVSGPVVATPSASYVATSDGTSGVDGTFNLTGEYANNPLYKHETDDYYILRSGCSRDWRISNGYQSYHLNDNVYNNYDTGDTPPETGWSDEPCQAMGTAPTLSLPTPP